MVPFALHLTDSVLKGIHLFLCDLFVVHVYKVPNNEKEVNSFCLTLASFV